MLQAILRGRPQPDAKLPQGACFPLSTEEQFLPMEEKLSDSAFADGVVSANTKLVATDNK